MSFSVSEKDKTTDNASAARGRRFLAAFAGIFRGRGKNAAYSRTSLPVLFFGGVLAGLCICLLLKGILISFSAAAHKSMAARAALRSPSFAAAGSSVGLAAVKDMRANGWEPLGNWHSHPASPSRPSEEDRRLAYDSLARYLILSLQELEQPVLKAFRIAGDQVEQEEITYV